MNLRKIYSSLGPGLLYAAAAIGVSHLVQSTRAGADFSFYLIWAIILANLLKYPFFLAGPKYTSITNESLLAGYKRIGPYALAIFFIITFATMFTVQSAVTIVTAGLVSNIFQLDFSIASISLGLLILCGILLRFGKFDLLNRLVKFIIIILSVTTFFTVLLALFADFPKEVKSIAFSWSNKSHIFFLIALVGWMPAPLDMPIWQSMWTLASKEKKILSVTESTLDFNIGFIGTAILAILFLTLGSLVMHNSGISFSSNSHEFAGQLISMYTKALGTWAYPIIALCAFTTMFSTTLTCLDAFPRILNEATKISFPKLKKQDYYFEYLVLTIIGATLILFYLSKDMKSLVDFATTLSFLVAPFFAYLNFKVMRLPIIGPEFKNSKWVDLLSYLGLLFLVSFSGYFIYLKLAS